MGTVRRDTQYIFVVIDHKIQDKYKQTQREILSFN